MKRILYIICRYAWIAISIISLVCISLLVFSSYRPFGYAIYYKEINLFILTMSCSVIASSVFYLFNEFLPSIYRRKVTQIHISREVKEIHEQLRLAINIEPFSFIEEKYTKSIFGEKFSQIDLYEKYEFDSSKRKNEILNMRKEILISKCENLLISYGHELSYRQLNFIENALQSVFLLGPLIPIDFSIPQEFFSEYNKNNNQKEIGESIFELYSQSKYMSKF